MQSATTERQDTMLMLKKRMVSFALALLLLMAAGAAGADSVTSNTVVISFEVTAPPAQTQTPEPEATPQPEDTADTAVRVRQFYLSPERREVGEGQQLMASLVLQLSNAEGTCPDRFGIRFDFSQMADAAFETVYDGENVRLEGDTLWVENAVIRGGVLMVAEKPLECVLRLTPFAAGGEAEKATVLYSLLDADANEMELPYGEEAGAIVRRKMTLHCITQEAQPGGEEALPTPGAAEETPVSEDAEPTPTPEPPQPTPLARKLIMHANIAPENVKVGDALILTAELVGYEDVDTVLRWEHRRNGVWDTVADAQGESLTIHITQDNHNDAWRYDVTVLPKAAVTTE